ncbi:MAG TPA: GxxExxY protein [Rectinemataceae bacterium]|nr:GxxExxY protein [Rectinemataceae bacterium]
MAESFDEGEFPHIALTERIIKCAIAVHTELGPGLLESIYEEAMTLELQLEGLSFVRQVELPMVYKGHRLAGSYRIDMVVENEVVVELKAATDIHPIHEAQLLTYLRLGGWKVGLLLNFNYRLLRDGVKRIVLSS